MRDVKDSYLCLYRSETISSGTRLMRCFELLMNVVYFCELDCLYISDGKCDYFGENSSWQILRIVQ